MDQPFEAVVRAYRTPDQYHRDAPKMEAAGWTIADVSERPWRGGCLRIVLLGPIGDQLFPPKQHTVVTYMRGRL